MDVQAKLDEITAMVEGARAMPLSASCVLNRGELLTHLDELKAMLPTELAAAQDLLLERSAIVDEGREEADRVRAEAQAERTRLVAKTDVYQEAAREAEHVVEEAKASAGRLQAEVDDYVDAKLANFEVVLHKTLRTVERGREKLRGRSELDRLAADADVDDPLLS